MNKCIKALLENLRYERDVLISSLDTVEGESSYVYRTIGKLSKVAEMITALENILEEAESWEM